MGNCLVTKLKGSVDNDDLLKLGEIRFLFNQGGSVTYNEQHYIHIVNSKAMELNSNKDMFGPNQVNFGRQLLANANQNNIYIHTFEQGQKLKISEKYSITLFALASVDCDFDVSELNYMPGVSSLFLSRTQTEIPRLHGVYDMAVCKASDSLPYAPGCKNVGQFEGTKLYIYSAEPFSAAEISAIPSNVKIIQSIKDGVDVSQFAAVSSLETLMLVNCSNVTGAFSPFGNIASFKTILGCPGCRLSGSLEQFVANKRAAGVTQDSEGVAISYVNGLTFNGSPVTYANTRALTWTATTITFDGVTIDA